MGPELIIFKATRPPASGVSPMGREFRIILRTACGEINNSSISSFGCGRGAGPIGHKIVILKATRPPTSGAGPMGRELIILNATCPPASGGSHGS